MKERVKQSIIHNFGNYSEWWYTRIAYLLLFLLIGYLVFYQLGYDRGYETGYSQGFEAAENESLANQEGPIDCFNISEGQLPPFECL